MAKRGKTDQIANIQKHFSAVFVNAYSVCALRVSCDGVCQMPFSVCVCVLMFSFEIHENVDSATTF